jgi:hypothetical protein
MGFPRVVTGIFNFPASFCRVETVFFAKLEDMVMSNQVASKESIGAAIGRIPSGVFVITAQRGEQKIGMMASWVAQAGFEPPCISVAIHPEREIYAAIEESGRFSVNVPNSLTVWNMSKPSRGLCLLKRWRYCIAKSNVSAMRRIIICLWPKWWAGNI